MHAVQAAGSSPVINALDAGVEFPDPVKPQTVAKSIAIGNPADGYHVLEAVRATGGAGARVSGRADPGRGPAARRDGRRVHRARRRRHARRARFSSSRRRHPAGRIDRGLHHRQRLQDGRRDGRPHRRTGAHRPILRGVRELFRRRSADERSGPTASRVLDRRPPASAARPSPPPSRQPDHPSPVRHIPCEMFGRRSWMDEQRIPNQAANQEQAEGSRETVNANDRRHERRAQAIRQQRHAVGPAR